MGQDEEEATVTLSPLSYAFLVSLMADVTENWFIWSEISDEDKPFVQELAEVVRKELLNPMAAVPIGAIMPFFGVVVPQNWVECAGGQLDAALYPELAEITHNNYLEVIGEQTFINLPNFRGRYPLATEIGLIDPAIGQMGGDNTHILTVNEMPNHSHGYTGVTLNLDLESPGVPDIQGAGILPFQYTDAAGGDEAFNIQNPFQIIPMFIMRVR